jgi:hypothetical protein
MLLVYEAGGGKQVLIPQYTVYSSTYTCTSMHYVYSSICVYIYIILGLSIYILLRQEAADKAYFYTEVYYIIYIYI